jgi:deazaflavin-dependent oxidoreductase (nitroreductase family)
LGIASSFITHTGRISGRPRCNVIEVVRHDCALDRYYVASGWGETADWYRNIRKQPRVTLQAGVHEFPALAEFVPAEQAIGILTEYARWRPSAFRELTGLFLGKRMQPNGENARLLAGRMPMLVFLPLATPEEEPI